MLKFLFFRKCWVLQPDQYTLENPIFHSTFESLVTQVQDELGCGNKNIKAEPYKLLLYEKGGHFKPHRDSEKQDGMFATLVLQLPSIFKGNHFIINHGDKTKMIELDQEKSKYEMLYVAHYADCEHEVLPLESGYRMALVYNLIWTGSAKLPSFDKNNEIIEELSILLSEVSFFIISADKNVYFILSLTSKFSPKVYLYHQSKKDVKIT